MLVVDYKYYFGKNEKNNIITSCATSQLYSLTWQDQKRMGKLSSCIAWQPLQINTPSINTSWTPHNFPRTNYWDHIQTFFRHISNSTRSSRPKEGTSKLNQTFHAWCGNKPTWHWTCSCCWTTHQCHLFNGILHRVITLFSDQTGKFPVKSSRENLYIFVLFKYDNNSVLPSSHNPGCMSMTYNTLLSKGYQIQHHILYNECSQELKAEFSKH